MPSFILNFSFSKEKVEPVVATPSCRKLKIGFKATHDSWAVINHFVKRSIRRPAQCFRKGLKNRRMVIPPVWARWIVRTAPRHAIANAEPPTEVPPKPKKPADAVSLAPFHTERDEGRFDHEGLFVVNA